MDIKNAFIIADCANTFEHKGMTLIKTCSYNIGITVYLYRSNKNSFLTISPCDFQDFVSFIKIGIPFLSEQELIEVDDINMNKFMADYGAKICNDFEEHIIGKIYMSGIGIAGGLIQSVYYFLCKSPRVIQPTKIITFGAPRIGDENLHQWFKNDSNLDIRNFVYCPNNKVDPVCLFPGRLRYVHNINFTPFNKGKILDRLPEQNLTDISVLNFNLDDTTAKLWKEIHNIELYWENLP